MNRESNSNAMKTIFSGLITGVVMMTALNEAALANKTYFRAKTCYQDQYIETYYPETGKILCTSAVEKKGLNSPAPRTSISMGAKAISTRRGIAPTLIQLIDRRRLEEEGLSRLPLQRTTVLVWKEPSMAAF